MANPTRAELRNIWRKLTGEHFQHVPPESVVDFHLQAGLEAFNEIVGYYVNDDATTTLVAATQEYDLPADNIETIYVRWNGRFLDPTDQETLRRNSKDWISADTGDPEQFYLHGRKIGLVPAPSAATVDTSAVLTIRQVATPAPFGSNPSVQQLASMHRRIPVYFAVAEWFAGQGGNGEKAGTFMKLFTTRAAEAAKSYADRKQH